MTPRLALLAALAALLLLPVPADAKRPLELGVQDDAVLLHRAYGDLGLALDRAREMGADRIRVNLAWASAMPWAQAKPKRKPAAVDWDFSALERVYAAAAARGIPLQVSLTGPAPAWATRNRKVGFTRPSASAYGDFARAAASAFAGRIGRWSVWNEPNWHRLLQPTKAAPSIYRGLYRTAYAQIKQVDRSNQVLIGELMPGANRRKSTQALKFLRAMLCARANYTRARRCATTYADGFALHPYQFASRPKKAVSRYRDVVEIGALPRLTRALDKLARARLLRTPRGGRMPVYLTEFGYWNAGPLRLAEKTRAAWIKEAWRIAERNPRVRQLLQYGLIDPWHRSVSWRTAVLKRNGARTKSFYALKKLAR